jgi:hypothetical protein
LYESGPASKATNIENLGGKVFFLAAFLQPLLDDPFVVSAVVLPANGFTLR